MKARAKHAITVTLLCTLLGKLTPILWMGKLRLWGVAGETWKVHGFHSVSPLQQGLPLGFPDLLQGKHRSFDLSRDSH